MKRSLQFFLSLLWAHACVSLLFFIFNSSRLNYFLYIYILTQERGSEYGGWKPLDLDRDLISALPPCMCAYTCTHITHTRTELYTNALYSRGASLTLLLATLFCHSCQESMSRYHCVFLLAALLFGMLFPARLLSPSPPSSPSFPGWPIVTLWSSLPQRGTSPGLRQWSADGEEWGRD